MKKSFSIFLFTGLFFVICAESSIAALLQDQQQRFVQGSDLLIRIGALGFYRPEYEGGNHYEFRGFPFFDITWRNIFFLNPRKGLGAYIWNRGDIKLALSAGYSFGRDEDDSNDLDGLGDIDSGANANILFEWAPGDIAFDTRYEQQITGADTGSQVHLSLSCPLQIGGSNMIKPSVKTTYASSGYMEEYFGISPVQAARSGLPVYNADSGFKSLGLQVMSIFRLDKHLGIQAMIGCDRLIGEAADSPVVRNVNQCVFSLGLSRRF
jgi:outer membrane scaffolding protein for murein synthesis (MipA/OmpV family)